MPNHQLEIEKSFVTLGDLLIRQRDEQEGLFINHLVLDKIVAFNLVFPEYLSSFYGFEIPLSDALETDFLFCVHKPEMLLRWSSSLKSNLITSHPFFSGISDFAANWTRQFPPHISNIWFEYDYNEILRENYVPSFFVGPTKGLHPLHLISMLQPLLSKMGGCADAESYKCLLKVMRQMPHGSWLSQVGQMLARGDNHLRVFIQDLPKGSIPDLLDGLGYKGKMNTGLLRWMKLANQYCKKVELDLDIGKSLGKQLGLELYFEEMESALAFLKKLQQDGLCTQQKYDRLYSYLCKLRINKTASSHQFFSHFKIGFNGESTFKAKAYMGFITNDQMPFAFGTKPLKITKQ